MSNVGSTEDRRRAELSDSGFGHKYTQKTFESITMRDSVHVLDSILPVSLKIFTSGIFFVHWMLSKPRHSTKFRVATSTLSIWELKVQSVRLCHPILLEEKTNALCMRFLSLQGSFLWQVVLILLIAPSVFVLVAWQWFKVDTFAYPDLEKGNVMLNEKKVQERQNHGNWAENGSNLLRSIQEICCIC